MFGEARLGPAESIQIYYFDTIDCLLLNFLLYSLSAKTLLKTAIGRDTGLDLHLLPWLPFHFIPFYSILFHTHRSGYTYIGFKMSKGDMMSLEL